MLNKLVLCLTLIVVSGYAGQLSAADIYKTVDEDGNVTYSDIPASETSEKVTVKGGNSVPATPVRPAQPSSPTTNNAVNYQVTVTSPKNDYHLTPGERDLSVSISTRPALRAKHNFVITDNGSPVDGRTITNITPGTHSIGAKILDENGKLLGQATPITVHVHRVNRPRPTPRAN